MDKRDRQLKNRISDRMVYVREKLGLSRGEMADKLGIKLNSYYKNECGDTIPGMKSLKKMQQDYDISLDWFFFGKGPIHFSEKNPAEPEPQRPPLAADVEKLVDAMDQDPILRYEILLQFFRYQEQKKKGG